MEGYLRTDDRMRLAKERREERERSLGKESSLFRLVENKVDLYPDLRKTLG